MIHSGRFFSLPTCVRTRRLLFQQNGFWVREVLVDQIPTDTLERWFKCLDEDEQSQVNRLISNDRKKEVIAAHALLRSLASDITNTAPKAFRFMRDATGQKPHLLSNLNREFDVNLTHCKNFAACAVSERCNVGIDAEDLLRSVSASDLFSYFAPEEQQWLKSLSSSRADQASLQLWSLKEAVVKAIGCGLTLDLTTFGLLQKRLCFVGTLTNIGNPTCWRFWQFYPTPRHVLSIAAKSREDTACILK